MASQIDISTKHEFGVGCPSISQEDIPMTLQVGMVGADGIVLASDTRWVKATPIVQTLNSTKITISHERGIAIASARNMELSVAVARAVVAEIGDEEQEDPCIAIEKIASRIADQSSKERREIECLIVLTRPTLRLFVLRTGITQERYSFLCVREDKKAVAGDNLSSAIFFAMRYYENKPVCSLVPLAAQVVVAGNLLNPQGVEDLEVVVCDATGIHSLTTDSVRALQTRARALDETIRTSPSKSQQLAYAPNVIC
jgi:hypothetical protein